MTYQILDFTFQIPQASRREGVLIKRTLVSETAALIVWAWKHGQTLDLEAGQGFPETLQSTVHAFWQALALFHRYSSLAESLHSWLHPYLETHRGMPNWLLPLLQFFCNHHTFQRGNRQGKS